MRFASLALACSVLGLPVAAHADLLGDTVNIVYAYPDSTTTFANIGTYTVPSSGAIVDIATFQLTGSQVIITDSKPQRFLPSDFNGLEFTVLTGDPQISDVTLDPLSTFTGAQIAFSADTFSFNFQGLTAFTGQQAIFDLSFAPPSSVTPEPSSFLLLVTGLLGAAGVMRRRFARS